MLSDYKHFLSDEIFEYVVNKKLNHAYKPLLKRIATYKGLVTKYLDRKYPLEHMKILEQYGCTRDNTFLALCIPDETCYHGRIEFKDLPSRLLPMHGSMFDRNIPITELNIDEKKFREVCSVLRDYNKNKEQIKEKIKVAMELHTKEEKCDSILWYYFDEIPKIDWDKLDAKAKKRTKEYQKKYDSTGKSKNSNVHL